MSKRNPELLMPSVAMTQKAQKAARALAVRYSAYNEALDKDDYSGIRVWGDLLLKAQVETGVTLYAPANIRWRIADAAERLEQKAAA